MPSSSALQADESFSKAVFLRNAALPTMGAKRAGRAQIVYHAALTICVASWDAYLNSLISEFYASIAKPLDASFYAMSELGKRFSDGAVSKFNTPNFENSRNLLVSCTGYDPYPDWQWQNRKMGVLQVQERLNQILRVRHSFAHGFAIPAYAWTQSRGGKIRLTDGAVNDAELLLRHLVAMTDKGVSAHIDRSYGVQVGW